MTYFFSCCDSSLLFISKMYLCVTWTFREW